jgi:hypothetical protein
MEWNKDKNSISDAQFGFQTGWSTSDATFALQSLITQKLNTKQCLYCCFIDYKKAFDTINRDKFSCRTVVWLKITLLWRNLEIHCGTNIF